MEILIELAKQLEAGNDEKVHELTGDAINKKIDPKKILNDGLITGMNVIGEQFRKHEIFLPDVLLAAKAMYAGMELLKPLFIKDEIPTLGKIVIGTVKGDLHDLGKNLVGIMLKGAGFDVIDLGKDVSPEKFVETALKENAHLIGMSALLTTTTPVMKEVIFLLKDKNLNGKIKTIIGGAPVSKEYAEKIGADAYAFDAANSVIVAKELIA
ncbi:MAG: corrinoid protein [Ignavibacteria bacterium]|jgi:5-methyltetrahydrofolate--homocysteine methyltransferase